MDNIDKVDADNERHRREEQERRAKRKAARSSKSESSKERKRREHAQRILNAQKPTVHSYLTSPFQSLFHRRAEGFLIDLKFRNAPPRPPVGPHFLGHGLNGEISTWTSYRPRNAVESSHVWKIHTRHTLTLPSVPAMDWGGTSETDELHKDDEALLRWTGSMTDSTMEALQRRRDRARAAARLAHARGALRAEAAVPAESAMGGAFRLKRKHHLNSRILDEKTPNFMKKTTYITNDVGSVHRFTSLARTQEMRANDVDRAVAETREKHSEVDMIERGFKEAGEWCIVVTEDDEGHSEGNKKKRLHPTKKDVFPVWDLPVLPDVATWGYTHTHVVLDNPPKSIGPASKIKKALVTSDQLRRAIVADVTKQTQNARMSCTVSVPQDSPEKDSLYRAVQRYDLDVVPLRDASVPPVHFVLRVDPAGRYVGYHPVGSRVQLSTGRPVGEEDGVDESIILRREMEGEEREELERRMAEVDADLAEKHGLVVEEGGGGANDGRVDEEEAENEEDDTNFH